jgi:ribose/xylose/arabinose/galactoside ABC-type transport system permease subunit
MEVRIMIAARLLESRTVRPFVILMIVLAVFGLFGGARIFTTALLYSVFQQFATLGPVALGLGLTMMIGGFDLSVGSIFGLAGIFAIMVGEYNPLLGIFAAVLAGVVSGLVQSILIVKLRIDSIGITLGGLLMISGVSYVVTGNSEIGSSSFDIAQLIERPFMGAFSIRFLIAAVMFMLAAITINYTRIGRDLIATGSARQAALIAGVSVNAVAIVAFVTSGALAALSGGMLSFSLAAASPLGLADILVPAAAGAIIGGVSLAGGVGRPIGIAGGVLVLCVLRSGLTAIGAEPFVHNLVSGVVLLFVGIFDGEELARRSYQFRSLFR